MDGIKYLMKSSTGREIRRYRMGAWGAKLYENDTALDVRDRFDDLQKGKTVREITNELIGEYANELDDIYCAPTFWFALADTQWNLGKLLPEVKEQALAWIKKGGDLSVWQEENQALAITREKVLRELSQKLNSPLPPEKKISQHRIYKCEWKIGDVYAYQLESELAKEKGLFGRYFLIQKVDEGIWHPGHIVPIVYVKITKDEKLPACTMDIDQLEFVQTWFTKYEDRFLPIDGIRPNEDIAEKSKIKYEVDNFGFLPQFRVVLLNTSKKIIPTKLVFIGNYHNIALPKGEFIPHDKNNITTVHWENLNETFETRLIKKYCSFNLRESKIYQAT